MHKTSHHVSFMLSYKQKTIVLSFLTFTKLLNVCLAAGQVFLDIRISTFSCDFCTMHNICYNMVHNRPQQLSVVKLFSV